jgi:hypothetical protein
VKMRTGTLRATALLSACLLIACSARAVPPAAAPGDPTPNTVQVAGAAIHVDFAPGEFALGAGPLLEWVRRSANIVAGYYGRFPTARLELRLQPESGAGVQGGQTFGGHGAFMRVRVGRDVTPAQLSADWVLVHEMTHLALPDSGSQHAWLSEGIATYVEGVARVQAGNRAETDVWAEELRSMPRGLPQAGDAGLDNTHTWGRTYWGGALYCLLADIGIRKNTANAKGLEHALRAINRAGGTIEADWPLERVLDTGDKATDGKTLMELYHKMRNQPVMVDLPDLWKQLGVARADGKIVFDDRAPLAAVRKAIMR